VTKLTAQLVSGFGLIISTLFTPTFSATVVNGGVIHFQGAIVVDPCEITPQQQQFSMTCPEKNRLKTRIVSYEDALNGINTHCEMATLSMKYLDSAKTLAVVQIQYQ